MTLAPVTINYPNGSSLLLTRDGNTVTAVATPSTTATFPNSDPIPFPSGFAPANSMYGYLLSVNAPLGAPHQWGLIMDTANINGFGSAVGLVSFGSQPFYPFVTQWEAAPLAPVTDGYVLNPQEEQDSITQFLRETYPHIPVIEDGLLDGEYDVIQYETDETVRPFIVLWYSQIKRNPNGRSFHSYKLDSHSATVDVVVVASSGTIAREILNDVADKLVGFRTKNGGRMHKGAALWGDSRQVIDDKNKPERWARTDRFDFGVSARKVEP